MRKVIICLFTMFALTITVANAGPGHNHDHSPPITKEKAIEKATASVKNIVKKGKIDATWKDVVANSCEKHKIKHGFEWKVIFKNPKVKDKTKQTLYVFLTSSGKYIAANFTGK